MEMEIQMEIQLYFQMIKRGWWIILLTTLIALATSLAVSYFVTPQYEAVARFIISPGAGLVSRSDVLNSLDTLDRQSVVTTYAEIMKSTRIYNDMLTALGLRSSDLTEYSYDASVLPSSSILELRVSGPNPQVVAEVANAVGNQTIDFTRSLNQIYNVEFLDVAAPPLVPVSPQPVLYAGMAIILGLAGGVFIAILSEQLRTPIDTLRQRLHLDNITGVYNKRYFSRLVEEQLVQVPDEIHSIGIVELTGLQDIIETFPITSLQRVFRRVTETLRKELRGNDIIGRWNDISFIVMLPNTPGMAAQRIFERIFYALSESIDFNLLSATLNLNAHIGGAEYSNQISSQELFEKADIALDQARRDKTGRVYVWELENPFWVQKKTVEE